MTDKKDLELQFAADCKVIELKYEYAGYTGEERYGLITGLSEQELCCKYGCMLDSYAPYIVLDLAFAEVRDDFRRNEKKFEKRGERGHLFGIDDEFDVHHPECASPDCLEAILGQEAKSELWSAIQRLNPLQQKRVIKHFFLGMTLREIAREEGVNHSAVVKSIDKAKEKLKKIIF
jgi:RNA polymerase sigma factor (sigma-70 family)